MARILVIDDDGEMRALLRRLLEREGHEVVEAFDGDEGLRYYRLRPADLEIEGNSMSSVMSMHEVSVLPALRMEALAGRKFADVTIFGVQPETVAWTEHLSPSVAEGLEKLVQAVARYLDELVASKPIHVGAGAAHGSDN